MIDRRGFLALAAGALLWPVARGVAAQERAGEAPGVDAALRKALEESRLVYVSPLRSDGSESTCHGEVWYAYLDGAVVLNTAASTWKARALSRGLDRARIWVGDHGPWKRMLGYNEEFRKAPRFDARAERVKDEALLERLLASYGEKYPEEIGRWRGKMRAGFHDGSRVLIRYRPERT